ncbi:glycosyltransferase [Enterovibrio norvegicus]|uniref:glycosyltransferase family 25 protein n=1 Tax=Enterovibrio norvegicus TaxID=188144 RepID=UPI000C846D6D|nr:glycosyltransferase family 25 protein [Enterovibrio norvegicus]MCC4797879.1 glycosyltransferase family 25 protein [Enterovibrio norvegicus]PMI33018.1 glycosyltransferase [Enterovibrio norvegicus]PMI34872.1 glycosyltransferase [Enterovibrio norvegicus]PMN45079.1 glycosyltransferase [Enterovibrio norvegicus]TKF11026.1 glycosyltransferase family 25 protein [Enterovibrio norvegicus]
MPNVFVISLKRSAERREKIAKEMAEKNISFTFFDAVDGHQGSPELAVDYDYSKRLWLTSGYMPSKGELGCYASHYALWIKCLEIGEPIVVCEDDITLSYEAAHILSLALENVHKYGFLRLEAVEPGSERLPVEHIHNGTINLMKDNYGGTRAYAISPAAAMRLVKHRWCFPVDCFIGANFIHGQFSYQMEPLFVQLHGEDGSTVQDSVKNRTPLYRKPSREFYTLYKKVMLSFMYWKKRKEIRTR